MNRIADAATVVLLVVALGVGAASGWTRFVIPILESRPVVIENWEAIAAEGHLVGDSLAPLQILEFGDYQCPACRLFEERLNAFRAENPGMVAVRYRHWPLSYHAAAYPAARAAECAADQGRFETMHSLLLTETAWMTDPTQELDSVAVRTKVPDMSLFRTCVTNQEPVPRIEADIEAARAIGGLGTPTLVINGVLMRGLPDVDLLSELLTDALALHGRAESLHTQAHSTAQETGDQVVTTVSPSVVPLREWTLSSSPSLTLGMADGSPEELFHNLTGAVQLTDGRIAVVDAGRSVVTFFDGNGGHLRTVGGAGDGPEDLRYPRLLPAAAYDSLVVYGVSRISVVGLDGSITVAGSYTAPDLPRAVIPEGLVYQRFPHMGSSVANSGPRPTDPELLLVDLYSGARTVLARYRYATDYIVVSDRGQFTLPLPLRAGLSVAAIPGGDVAVVVANEGVLRIIRPSTGGSSSVPLPIAPVAVTSADVERFTAETLERASAQDPQLASVLRNMPFPDEFPFVESMVPDGTGGVWARLNPEHARRLGGDWLALSSSGEARALIRVPDQLDLFQVGAEFVIGTSRDELGIQRVHRYDLDRTAR